MASVEPFEATRYNPEHVKLGGVLAPPYDVIRDAQREELYGRDLRNIVRIDYGMSYPDDDRRCRRPVHARRIVPHLVADLGVLVRDTPRELLRRRSPLSAPGWGPAKAPGCARDGGRHALGSLRPASTRTNPARAQGGPPGAASRNASADEPRVRGVARCGRLVETLDIVAIGEALLGGRIDGEIASEKLLLWRVADQKQVEAIDRAVRGAALYVADGHHRYETAAAYAAERRDADADAPPGARLERCLVYLAAADDPGITILPTHRLVRPGPGIAFSLDDLWARLDDVYEAVPAADGRAALAAAASMHSTHHAFAVVAHDGAAVLRRPRRGEGSPRDRLDVAVLEAEVLGPAGVSRDMISGGALAYTRDPGELDAAVTAVRRFSPSASRR